MGVVVQFDFALWTSLYPAFAKVPVPQAQNYFTIATSIHANDGSGPVRDPAQQLALLNMLTAHIAYLFGPADQGGSGSPLVGRINSATEGSVSVQAAYSNNVSERMAWFVQSKYGAMYWAATNGYRRARYVPNFRGRGVVGPTGFGY